jgi:hypothetical protein
MGKKHKMGIGLSLTTNAEQDCWGSREYFASGTEF